MTSRGVIQKFRFERLDDRIVPCYLFAKSGSYRIQDCYRQVPKVNPVIDLQDSNFEHLDFEDHCTTDQTEDAVDLVCLATFVFNTIPSINAMQTYVSNIQVASVR